MFRGGIGGTKSVALVALLAGASVVRWLLPGVLALGIVSGVASATSGHRVQATWRAGRGPCCLAVVGRSLFVGSPRDGLVLQIDPSTNRIVWKTLVPPETIDFGSFVPFGDALWIVYHGAASGGIARLDPVTHRQARVSGLSDSKHPLAAVDPSGLVALNGSLWVGDSEDNLIHRLDPKTARVSGQIAVRSVAITQLAAAAGGSLWLTQADAAHSGVYRVDPATGRVIAHIQPFSPSAQVESVVAVGKALWVSVTLASVPPGRPTVFRIDTDANRVVATLRPAVTGNPDTFPALATAGNGTIWLQTSPSTLRQIDPTTGAPGNTLTIPLPSGRPPGDYYPSQIAVGFGSDWVTTWPGQGGATDYAVGSLLRIAPR